MIIWYDNDISFLRQLKTQFSATFFIDYDLLLCFERFRERSQNALCNSTGDLDSCIGWPSKDAGTGREKWSGEQLDELNASSPQIWDISGCMLSKKIKLSQVASSSSSWSLEVEAAHHQRRGVKFWHWWMDEVGNERNPSFYSILCKPLEPNVSSPKSLLGRRSCKSWMSPCKRECPRRNHQKQRYTMQGARTARHHGIGNLYQFNEFNGYWCRMSYVLPVLLCCFINFHRAMSGSGPGACQSGWCREPSCRDSTCRGRKDVKRCLEYEVQKNLWLTWRLEDLTSSCPAGHLVKEAVENVTREFSVQGHAVVTDTSLPEIPLWHVLVCISYLQICHISYLKLFAKSSLNPNLQKALPAQM